MILWSFQPVEIWDLLQKQGLYRCDPAQIDPDFVDAYNWLVKKMKEKIGLPPEGVEYPIWAWYIQNWKHAKPDLRGERWHYGNGGELYACIEIEIPDKDVLLSDFDNWHCVLNRFLISETEEEDEQQDAFFETLPESEKKSFMEKNWERIFDIRPLDNGWTSRGKWVQAVFWELKKEQIRKVRFFKTVHEKN
ncbi:MAG: DUF3841 domain-containing protein [Lachnospiraceae bacterium]|nr:DUF3841 domain-containing protein [Lachnospiraceae bacterium]